MGLVDASPAALAIVLRLKRQEWKSNAQCVGAEGHIALWTKNAEVYVERRADDPEKQGTLNEPRPSGVAQQER